jgi:hypothetical protein
MLQWSSYYRGKTMMLALEEGTAQGPRLDPKSLGPLSSKVREVDSEHLAVQQGQMHATLP